MKYYLTIGFIACFLSACGSFEVSDSAPTQKINLSAIPDAVPKAEPRSRYGNPKSYVIRKRRYFVSQTSKGYKEKGIASWYGTKFHGRRTSSGEKYNMYAMTAAHKTLPLPTYAEVTNLNNGKRIIVKINDRGPFHDNRIIDLSYAGAAKLGITKKGTGVVEVRALDPKTFSQKRRAISAEQNLGVALYLQLGAFSNRNNADNLIKKLNGRTPATVAINPLFEDNKTLYRVRVGPLSSVEQADALAEKYAALGLNNLQIIIE